METEMKISMGVAALALALVGLAGTAATAQDASVSANATQIRVGQAVRLTPERRASLDAAFAWRAGDAGVLASDIRVGEVFRERAGSYEKQGRMVAKVRARADMATRMIGEARSGLSPVARDAVVNQTDWAAAMGRVEARMDGARARLAPSLIEAFGDIDLHAFAVPEGWTEEEIAAVLMATGDYEYVEPDWRVYPHDTTPNDPLYGNQWHHRSGFMNSVRAWDFATGGPDIIVAGCDTGVRLTHVDLASSLVPGFNAVTNLTQAQGGVVDDTLNGHGTATAGCFGAIGNNGTGVSGVGWRFGVMPVRVSDRSDGVANLSDILQGARWASDNGAFVANCSYGGSNSSQANSTGVYIRGNGGLLTFSSGNDGVEDQTTDRGAVIIVGASNQSNTRAGFSNYGVGIDVIAPGSNIYTTQRGGGYGNSTGTSFSAPLTAGALALIKAANPTLTNLQVEQILYDTALDVGTPGEDDFTGHGVVRVGEAVEMAVVGPSHIDLPFFDDFAGGVLSSLWRDSVGVIEVNQNAAGLDAGDYAMNLDATDSIETVALRAAVLASSTGEIRFSTQHRGVETGESLLVEYRDPIGNWYALATVTSDGADQNDFVQHRLAVPFLGMHDDLKLRFTAQGSDGGDEWYIDDVRVGVFESNPLPWATGFENGIDLNFDWVSSDAVATTEAPNTPEGSFSARLTGSGSMTSQDIDVSSVPSTLYARLRTLHTGVPAGQTLTVEYRDFLGVWQPLGQITSNGADQTAFALNQFQIPFGAFGLELAVRYSASGTSPDHKWYIDDVAVTEDFVVDPVECPADLAAPFGTLNFFDVSAFISLYNAQDPAADLAAPFGTLNFFDVSAYISAYNQGCP
jgi:hypothetical protein